MNTYVKYCPNVFLAKCKEKHEKWEVILVQTKNWKENESIVHNLVIEKEWFYYYSIVRADWMNAQEHARRKAERLSQASINANNKADQYWKASDEGKDFLSLAEPIKIWHHSEKRHRALIERNHNRANKAVEQMNKAEDYQSRIAYWESKTNDINLSMPESIEYYKYKLDKYTAFHTWLKNGTINKEHWYSIVYAKKDQNEAKKNYELAIKLRA